MRFPLCPTTRRLSLTPHCAHIAVQGVAEGTAGKPRKAKDSAPTLCSGCGTRTGYASRLSQPHLYTLPLGPKMLRAPVPLQSAARKGQLQTCGQPLASPRWVVAWVCLHVAGTWFRVSKALCPCHRRAASTHLTIGQASMKPLIQRGKASRSIPGVACGHHGRCAQFVYNSLRRPSGYLP